MDKPSYYSLNKEKILAYTKAYDQRFRDEKKQYYKEYYQKNKERLAQERNKNKYIRKVENVEFWINKK